MSGRTITIVASELLGRPGTGGAGTANSLLAVALARQGHRVQLVRAPGREVGGLSHEWASIYTSAGVEVRMLAGPRNVTPPYLAPALEVFRTLRERPPAVVIVDDWRGLGYVALRARQLGRALSETAFVVHCHGPARVLAEFAQKVPDTLGRFAEDVMERASIELADAVVSPSAWLLDWMRTHGWPVPASAAVVPYLCESTALGQVPPRAAVDVPTRRLAFFGQLREGKGIRIFLSALNALEPELLDDLELVFLGKETPRWTRRHIESFLPPSVRQRLHALRIETDLDRGEALAELLRPGTVAVMPSLLDNSPNTVTECLERGIPFVSTWTGGIPELVAEEDRDRCLCRPTSDDLSAVLARMLASRSAVAPVRPAPEPRESLEAWRELVETVAPSPPRDGAAATRVTLVVTGEQAGRNAERLAAGTRHVEVEIARGSSRRAGLARAASDWIVFLDDEDQPHDEMLDVLVAAQASSGADVVTAAVRPAGSLPGLRLFLGNPGALGLVENQYGVLALIRRSLLETGAPPEGAGDPDWPLLARLAVAGARIVSVPEALSTHTGAPGQIGDIPGEGLAVLGSFEAPPSGALAGLPQLAVTLAAAHLRLQHQAPTETPKHIVRRSLDVLHAEGIGALVERVIRKVRPLPAGERAP